MQTWTSGVDYDKELFNGQMEDEDYEEEESSESGDEDGIKFYGMDQNEIGDITRIPISNK